MPDGAATTLPPRLVLFDGLCGLCDKTVQWLLEHDPEGKLTFAPLQGETAAEVLGRHDLPGGLDSIVYVERDEDGQERVFWRSRAVFQLLRHLPTRMRHVRIFRFLPAFLTDLGYRLIAAIRYKVWGKRDACRIPTPDERARFLD